MKNIGFNKKKQGYYIGLMFTTGFAELNVDSIALHTQQGIRGLFFLGKRLSSLATNGSLKFLKDLDLQISTEKVRRKSP